MDVLSDREEEEVSGRFVNTCKVVGTGRLTSLRFPRPRCSSRAGDQAPTGDSARLLIVNSIKDSDATWLAEGFMVKSGSWAVATRVRENRLV